MNRLEELPDDVVDMLNAHLGGYNVAMGVRFVSAAWDEVTVEMGLGPQHQQPYGLTHGGVLCGLIESVCSAGAAMNVFPQGKSAVGLDNSTSFLRATRGGKLTCTARPLSRGRRTHVWQAEVKDDEGRVVATGRVRMLILEAGAEAAGEAIGIQEERGRS
jgi:uncharacterized protein (TIGR00369 family)